jgi:hypothetical protein
MTFFRKEKLKCRNASSEGAVKATARKMSFRLVFMAAKTPGFLLLFLADSH